jgi:hypothetical protein
VPEPRALKSDNLLLHLLLAPLAAALHVCHSSLSRVRVALRLERGLSRACESARPEVQSRPREAHGNVRCKALGTHPSARTCSPRRLQQPAAPSRTPPNAARAPREFLPLGRRGLRWRATRVAARPPQGGLLAGTRPRSRQPPKPSLRSRCHHHGPFLARVMIIGQPQGQRVGNMRNRRASAQEAHTASERWPRRLAERLIASAVG